ncbi:MAG: urea carboxylase-associated family protein [Deltaproteobacteria bacterium]|nr:urea carboxylase-associated family protein [Deltaproteobacteria bacterium]
MAPKSAPKSTTKSAAKSQSVAKSKAKGKAKGKRPSKATVSKSFLTETLRGGQGWSQRLARGQVLRIADTTGRACVSALFYNARDPIERYNMADTLKAQYTAFLTTGRVLYSDMGRVLVSIIGDTCGWHDTISGCGDAAGVATQFGAGSYQERRNDFYRNARDNFVVELAKRGLGKRDIVANVNFFVRVSADEKGQIGWTAGNSQAGAYVDLRAEMDTLVVLSNTPHPLDPSEDYDPPAVDLSIRNAAPVERPGPRDRCRLSRPENARGFAMTDSYVREVEGAGLAASFARGVTP